MLPETDEHRAATDRVELLRRVAAAQVNLTPAEAKVATLVLAEPSWVLGRSLMQVATRAAEADYGRQRTDRNPLLPLDRARRLPELSPAPRPEHRERCPVPADRSEP
jgi:hypothetical protein